MPFQTTSFHWIHEAVMKESESESHSVMSDPLQPHELYSPWNLPDQNTGVGSHSLLQGICPTQGSNPGLPHCRQMLYHLSHRGSPRILEWVAFLFSIESSQPRDWTQVFGTAGRFFTMWATREAPSFTWRRNRKIEICEPGRRLSPNTRSASILTLDFPTSRTVKINFYCFISHLIYGVVLQSRKKLRC